MPQPSARHPLPLVASAAAVAVGFWSLKPILISEIGDRASYLEVYLVAGAISVAVSVLIVLTRPRQLVRLGRDSGSLYGLMQAAISGVCLAAWYYGFYRALYGSAKVDATIIAFIWPLISVFAMRLFAPGRARDLTRVEFSLVIVAFAGAISIGLARLSNASLTSGYEIIFAFLAAIGAGFYLPFAINAASQFQTTLKSKIWGTFFSISVANLVALVFVGSLALGTGQQLLFYAFDTQVLLLCATIGIGTYLAAEITWTWAFAEYQSLTLTSLPYFSPALSVVMLFVFYDEPVSALSAFGLMMILFSNISLHGMYQASNAIVLALIGTLYVALSSIFLPRLTAPPLIDVMYFLSGLFAILAGFILARVSGRRAAEVDHRATLGRDILQQRTDCADQDARIDRAFRAMIDIEFEDGILEKETLAARARAALQDIARPDRAAARSLLGHFDLWFTIHRDRLSMGERMALWITGGGSILFLILLRPDGILGQIGLYAFSAGCLLVIFTISDYERNNVQGFRKQILRLQDGFRELGYDYYLPSKVVASREILSLPDDRAVRYQAEDGTLEILARRRELGSFRFIYMACSGLLLGALLLLPLSATEIREDRLERVIRPDVIREQVSSLVNRTRGDVVVGRFDWDSSQVIAHILAGIMRDDLGLAVSVRDAEVDGIFPEMVAAGGTIDVHPDFWVQNQPENFATYVENDGGVSLNATPYLGSQGLYLGAGTAASLALDSVADLADPAIAAHFDSDGDGRGEIWVGAAGWDSTALLRNALIDLGLGDTWDFDVYSETIFKARLSRYLAAGRPLLFYGYEPDWVHDAHDLLRLDDGGAGTPTCLRPLATDAVDCGFPPVMVHVAFATRLAETQPAAAALLRRVAFSTADVNGWVAETSLNDVSPEAVAQAWRAAHRARIEGWLAN